MKIDAQFLVGVCWGGVMRNKGSLQAEGMAQSVKCLPVWIPGTHMKSRALGQVPVILECGASRVQVDLRASHPARLAKHMTCNFSKSTHLKIK